MLHRVALSITLHIGYLFDYIVVSAARKAEKEEEEEVVAPVVDKDPVGELLLQTKEPLVQALKFLRPLEKAAPDQVQTWVLSYEVAIRRGLFFYVSSLFEVSAS